MIGIRFLIPLLFYCIIQFSCSTKDVPDKLEVAGVDKPVINLAGKWKFSMTPPDKFWQNDVDITDWPDIQVPGECQMQGFAIKHDTPYVYKTIFMVPKDYDGKQINLNFYGVYSFARVWVNGHFIRQHFGGFTKWTCDVTDFVEVGENALLTVEFTDRTDDISYGSGYAKHQIGGILRDAELTALPKQNFKQLYFETDLDQNYHNAELKVFFELSKNTTTELKIKLLDTEGKKLVNITEITDSNSGLISIPVKNPLKWDAEHPNLYTIVTTLLEDGKEILKTVERIGFREVEVVGNQMLINGKPVKLRGACRHDIHPELGRMTTPEYDLEDVLLAKECNMNFIRTSHYPPSEQFLEYCDEYGVYVEDETAICFVGSHRTEAYRSTGASQSDPEFTEMYLSQLEEMVQNHRNHPSVVIWSIGNENAFGSNFVEEYKWIKQNDLTRPVIFSYPGNVPDTLKMYDIISMHYPSWQGNLNQLGVKTIAFKSPVKPMLFDEWAHVACYNNFELKEDPNVRNFWGQSLDSMWTYTFEADGALGGAIWCMLDETFMLPEGLQGFNEWWGILDKNIIPASYEGPTVGYGEWGILDTWRRKKPEFWATKKAYSPTKVLLKQLENLVPGKDLKLPVHNRFDHTNFNELEISFRYRDRSGKINNVDIAPHNKSHLVIPAQEWLSGEKLYLAFRSPDGNLIDEYLIQLGKPELVIPELSKGTMDMSENKNQIFVRGENYYVTINKQTGLMNNLIVAGDTLIKSGPYINFRLPGKRKQYSTIEMADYAKNWKKKGLRSQLTDGIFTVVTEGFYDSISADFKIRMDASGLFSIDYKILDAPTDKMIQESGLKFIVGSHFKKLSWVRDPYFTIYPSQDLGRAMGNVNLDNKPIVNYREKPGHNWEMDSKGFYYHGLDETLAYTNIVRSMKENILSYGLSTGTTDLQVLSNAKQACRFDKIDKVDMLIIDNQWDYQSLLWGNYMKMIPSTQNIEGNVCLKISSKQL